MSESRTLRRSRIAMEVGFSPGIRETPSGRTRCSDCANGSSAAIQNRHHPVDSQPRNWASTDTNADGSARMVVGMDSRQSNAAQAASKDNGALGMKSMHGVISDFTFGRQERNARSGTNPLLMPMIAQAAFQAGKIAHAGLLRHEALPCFTDLFPNIPSMSDKHSEAIHIHGARQNNLKNLDVDLPLNELLVVTGVSGSGKSSLVFDTLYAEGQRRYVETFSPYARQFLDRMDKPQVDRIDGIPPAIAIDQTNPVRTSRSTLGTMTELNDHLKLLFARAGRLFCRGCGRPVHRDSPASVYEQLAARAETAGDPRLIVTFPVTVPKNFKEEEVQALLKAQGYDRIHARTGALLEVVQDRVKMSSAEKTRVIEGIEAAFKVGQGKVNVYPLDADGKAGAPWRYSSDLHCAECDIHYSEPLPSLFSFNSPLGACETCRGFGRVIGIDYGLIVPDESKTLREGAIRPWQSPSFHDCQDDIEKCAKKRGVPLDVPFRDLGAKERQCVLEGEPEWVSWRTSWPGTWNGVARFFRWLETKAYKMHVRVLLSRYRAYTPCSACKGARLKPEALLWRVGTKEDADRVLDPARRFRPAGTDFSDDVLRALPGLTVHDLVLLPAERARVFFEHLHLPAPLDEATDLLLTEIRARLRYVCEVGLGYLTLDRQSRTLSGGEVQRINLTTALGTSLVNTLFVLDEPSIGLHPRDMGRVIGVMQRLRDAGNSLVVVEHDPQIMLQADRIMDMGPGPGERGGEIVFSGTPDELKESKTLTAEYLSGRKGTDHGFPGRKGTDHGLPENRGLS